MRASFSSPNPTHVVTIAQTTVPSFTLANIKLRLQGIGNTTISLPIHVEFVSFHAHVV